MSDHLPNLVDGVSEEQVKKSLENLHGTNNNFVPSNTLNLDNQHLGIHGLGQHGKLYFLKTFELSFLIILSL